jgi:hypothetical protein
MPVTTSDIRDFPEVDKLAGGVGLGDVRRQAKMDKFLWPQFAT